MKCSDCSISEISDGASRVMPTICSLAAGQMQFGDVSVVGQNLAQRLEHDDAGRRLMLAPLQHGDRRAVATVAAGANGGATR